MSICGSAPPSSVASRLGSAPTEPTCPLPVLLLYLDWVREGSLLRPALEAGVVQGAVEVAGEAVAGQRGLTVVGTGEAEEEVPTEGCCLRGTEAAAGEAGGGDGGAVVGVLLRGEEAEEVRPEFRGGTGAAEEELRLGLWRGEGEEEPRGRPGTEGEGAAAQCCGEEEGAAGEDHHGMEEVGVLASGARSSQPRHLLSPQ